jgi:predicted small lipoprotein YifL
VRGVALAAAALALAVLAGGCGAKGPQVPTPQANKVASALEGISEACGENFQQNALPRFASPGPGPELAARMRALELAQVVRQHRERIYQGETLAEVAHLAGERLRECGLPGAADELHRLTAPAG